MKTHGTLFFITAAVLLLALVSCEQPAGPGPQPDLPPKAAMTGIRIAEPPVIQIYAKNQPFDPAGLVVAALYDGDTERVLGGTEYGLSEVNTALPGVKTITVRAGDFTEKFSVYVRSSTSVLNSISVTTPPSSLICEFGKDLNTSGMVVTGYYYDSETKQTTQETINLVGAVILGYDKGKRGNQSITVRVNNYQAKDAFAVTVRVPSSAVLSTNLDIIFLKGQSFSVPADFTVTVTANGIKRQITGLGADCFSGYNLSSAGRQTASLVLDDKISDVFLYVMDAEPELYFDYGFMRHQGDTEGYGPNKASWEADNGGRYYVKPGQKLVIAPVRFLLGYNADHSDDAGLTYSWNLGSLPAGTYTADGEFLRFTPTGAGTWDVSVTATGRHFITGETISKTANTRIVCFTGTLPTEIPLPAGGAANLWFLRNFSPGQFTEGGTGLGWSLGAYGGYAAWKLDRDQSVINIRGNAFATWMEPGIVWVMRDDNGNGMPDETWYELRGSDEYDVTRRDLVTRRMAMKYFHPGGGGYINEYNQLIKENYCVDAKGRTCNVPGGWSGIWGVQGDWVIYTGTMLRDTGNPNEKYTDDMGGYADTWSSEFNVSAAVYPDGTTVSPGLGPIRFVKVQTGVFKFPGGGVGEVSTEINTADTIGRLTDFPLPEDS